MRLSPEAPANELVVYSNQGKRLNERDSKLYDHFAQRLNDYAPDCQYLEETYGAEKPEWFQDTEQKARNFMYSVGFADLKPICLIQENDELEDLGFDDERVIAVAGALDDRIFVREKKVIDKLHIAGLWYVGAVLVHELAHDTATKVDHIAVFRLPNQPEYEVAYRSGFGVSGINGKVRGSFLEEGFAHFMSGWFVRSREEYSKVVDVPTEPTIEVPRHLNQDSSQSVAGPDGYAVELLAWGAERKSIMPAADFIAAMLDTRRVETQTDALRKVAQVINRIRPGLYMDLQRLEYGMEEWSKGLQLVFDSVKTCK